MPDDPRPAGASASAVDRKARRGGFVRRLKLFALLLPLVALALAGAYVWLALGYSYSTGDRAGYVQKFSRKGWVCKTWEGELAMVSLPGAMPEIYVFSVRDDAIAAQINQHLGERVVLTYAQHLALPSCFGETQYFVTGIRRVQP